jgi:hypothetical protein
MPRKTNSSPMAGNTAMTISPTINSPSIEGGEELGDFFR